MLATRGVCFQASICGNASASKNKTFSSPITRSVYNISKHQIYGDSVKFRNTVLKSAQLCARRSSNSVNRLQVQALGSSNTFQLKGTTAFELPCMLFQPYEVFLPGSRKVLHLYEARFLALLDECVQETGGLFAHLIFHPNAENELHLDRTATLCRIEVIERESVGARVQLVAEGRLQLQDVTKLEPFIKATFREVPTMADQNIYQPTEEETASVMRLVDDVRASLSSIEHLAERLQPSRNDSPGSAGIVRPEVKDQEDEMLWGHKEISTLAESMKWVESPPVKLSDHKFPLSMKLLQANIADQMAQLEACDVGAMPCPPAPPQGMKPMVVAERLSFAVLQNVPMASEADVNRLLSTRIEAMGLECGLIVRLNMAYELVDEQMKALRAKVAINALLDSGTI